RRSPAFTLFPYTTLFRSVDTDGPADDERIPDPDTHQDTTSATYADGQGTSISAFRVPYVVKPLGRRPGRGRCSSLLTRRPGLRRSEEHTSELQSPCNLVC